MSIPESPRLQFTYLFAIAFIFMLLGRLLFSANANFPWLVSAAFMLLFSILNNLSSIFAKVYAKYMQESLLGFSLLLPLLGASAWLLSGQNIDEAGPFRTIYLVLVIAHFSFAALCFMIRNIADFLKKKDEAQHRR